MKTENLHKQVKLLKLEIKPNHKDSDFSKLLSRLLEPANLTLNTCISLVPRFFYLTRLSLAEYSLYSGFIVLTPLQVLTVVMDIGHLSQTPHLSKLTLESHVKG